MNPGVDLHHPDASDHRLVGRKAAVLAKLLASGFPVPAGLILPVAALTAGARAEAIRGFAAQVAARFDVPVAVRSSASWEDLATSARAGASLTVLHVEGEAVLVSALERCVEALAEPSGSGAGVLVQPMLAPEHAGVAFTADPSTGERDVVRITAVEGVAEALVAGEVTGVDVTVRDGVVHGDSGTLPSDHALAVAEMARRLEAELGAPQDVEWAVVGGVVHVLQSRPITVLPVKPDVPAGGGWEKDVAHYSEPLTPFGFATVRINTEQAGDAFPRAGLLLDGIEERLVGGEVYGRVIPAIGPPEPGRLPPPPAPVMGLLSRLLPPLRARTRAARWLLNGGADEWVEAWEANRSRFLDQYRALLSEDVGAYDDGEFIAYYGRVHELVADGGLAHFEVIVAYVVALYELHGILVGIAGWDEAATAALLAGASPPTRASEEEMVDIRARVNSTPGAIEALRAAPRDPVGALQSVDAECAAALSDWLELHGWRAQNYDAGTPVLAERPTLVTRLLLSNPEAPDPDAAARAASRARDLLAESERDRFDEALARARHCYPLREDTIVLGGDSALGLMRRWVLEAGKRLVSREVLDVAGDASYLFPDELHAGIVGDPVAEELRGRVIRRRGEEAWARAHPGPLTLGRQSAPPDLAAVPDPLRKVNQAIMWFVSLEYPGETATPADRSGVLVRGVGVSPGVSEGPVRIVRDNKDLDLLVDGEILVCQAASPAWAPLFPLAAAVVADGGGALSHSAIAAREHGVPAVLGTRNASGVLRNGQRVRVDGSTGEVMEVAT